MEIDNIRISACENTHYRSEEHFGQDGPVSLSYSFDAPDWSIVFTGDTEPCRALESIAEGADFLVGELIDVDIVINHIRANTPGMSEQALQKMWQHFTEHHLTPEDPGKLAARAGVNHLVAVPIPFAMKSADDAVLLKRISDTFVGRTMISEDQQAY